MCVKGEGSGCEANASESPLVRKLLEKSRANRERNDQETLEKYWKQGYGDYFAYGNKKLVKNRDGTWALEEPDDLILEIGKRIAAMAKGDDNKK